MRYPDPSRRSTNDSHHAGEEAVALALTSRLGVDLGASPLPQGELRAALKRVGIAPFAQLVTQRSRFVLPGGLEVDCDVATAAGDEGARWMHAVIEVEKLVADPSLVAAADAEVQEAAVRPRLRPLGLGTGGKLEAYIRHFCPTVMGALLEAGILPQ